MSKMNILFIFLSIFFLIKCNIYIDRHNNYKATFDCLGDGKNENDQKAKEILTPEDCFDESPFRKYECCYFEDLIDDKWKNGCMKIYKGDEEDLNDLKDYVSKLSTDTVFNCKQSFLEFNFIFGVLLSYILFFV